MACVNGHKKWVVVKSCADLKDNSLKPSHTRLTGNNINDFYHLLFVLFNIKLQQLKF
jgi:hypothetical protein